MNNSQPQLKRFKYSGGKEFINRLKSALNETTDIGLAGRIGIPKGTIATWMQRNTTPYEVSIIAHLATGLSLRWLLLGEGEPFESTSAPVNTNISLTKEMVINGALSEQEIMKFDQSLLEYYGLAPSKTKLIEEGIELMMVNTEETNPTSGRYLIDVDGAVSINHIQRLPGKKLAMSFGSSSIEISESDIKVLGKVVMVMGKE